LIGNNYKIRFVLYAYRQECLWTKVLKIIKIHGFLILFKQ
jgi:hypothetical protein